VRRLLASLALVALVACEGSTGSTEEPRDTRQVCEPAFDVPGAFEPTRDVVRVTGPDYIGVRRGYRDDERRQLHFLTGIEGEIGEGLPLAGEVELVGGHTGTLLGRRDVWVVRWDEGDICDPRAVFGYRFTRREFMAALAEAGVAPPADG
jgi:hypothetical protein